MFARLLRAAERRGLAPRISDTERQALEAGTVWVERELFSGRPDLARLLAEPWPGLTAEESAFLDGPVEEVCRRVDPWRLERERRLPEEVWALLRAEGFFGLAIPKEHGGLGFSALARSAVFTRLASRALPLSVVVLIPNTVGPGELLVDYGTPEQRARWLPRLARGEEIPCFALTEPEAGSDAAGLSSTGTVVRGAGGAPRLVLDFDKRYITLAPVATLIGLAFRLRDPDRLLGLPEERYRAAGDDRQPEGELGITVALVPAATPGVEIGRRHDPMGIPFPNGPIRGRGVELGTDAILGGAAGAGRGWRMLMEALAAGRGVSLPAQSTAGALRVARVAGAYAAVRRQFGLPIARFEGIGEALGRIAGRAYLMEAARVWLCGALDAGHRPAVLSAAMKVAHTELVRDTVADGMDVVGGAALCRGPRNPLAGGLGAAAVGITVEGANILTRGLIVFGQGALRCHPWVRREMAAFELAGRETAAAGGRALARAVAGHLGSSVLNLARAALLDASRGRLARGPGRGSAAATAGWWRRLGWAAVRFAVLADLAILGLGPALKRREALAGRFADALGWWFLGVAALRRFEAEGRRAEDLPLAGWAAEQALGEIQAACEGIARNFGAPASAAPGRGGHNGDTGGAPRWLAALLRGPGLAWLRLTPLGAGPTDRLGAAAAAALVEPGPRRDRLTAGIHLSADPADPLGRLDRALDATARERPALEAIAAAARDGRLPAEAARRPAEHLDAAVTAGAIDRAAAALVAAAAAARRAAIEVDSFTPEEYFGGQPAGPPSPVAEPVPPDPAIVEA